MVFTLLDDDTPVLSDMEVYPMDTLSSTSIPELNTLISRPGMHRLVLKASPKIFSSSLDSFDTSIHILYVSDQPEIKQGNFTFGWKENSPIKLKEGEFCQRYLQIGHIDHDMGMVTAVVSDFDWYSQEHNI